MAEEGAPAPGSRPRLVATDLDGTLVHPDGSVSDRTRRVLVEVERSGVPVVFVTGRPLRWAEEVFAYVGDHGLAVVSNGGLVWDVARAAPHLVRPIEREVGLEVFRLIRAAVPGSVFAVETLDGIGLEPDFLERYPPPDGSRRGPVEELFVEPAVKLLARHEVLAAQDFWDAAEAAVQGLATITWSSSSSLLEISAAGVTKASTLALLCTDLGIDASDVIAFGDMPNDLPMLTWAGHSVGMANAHPDVLALVDEVTASNDDEGVAQVLERWF